MRIQGPLFRKYFIVFVVVIGGMLIAQGLIELYSSYRDNKATLVRLQKEKAAAAALRIENFIHEIEGQIEWASRPSFLAQGQAAELRRFDFLWLLHQVTSITEVSYLDATGKEQLRVSRLAMDEVGSQKDYSAEPKFREALAGNIYFGPVYFRKESEPYMTLAMKGRGQGAGVTVAELNLKLVWDVVSQIKVGKQGYAYVVDPHGTLIAHPDISLVLQKTDLSRLPQVQAALAAMRVAGSEASEVEIGRNQSGGAVLTASAPIVPLGWLVFVEQPVHEAFSPLYGSILRTLALLIFGLGLAVVASLILARSIVRPIQALQAGAAQIGAGALDHQIEVQTGDELGMLARQFNSMAAQLHESYTNLEQKVQARTRELTDALLQLKALGEVSQAVSSTLNLETVLTTIVTRAVQLSGTIGGVIYEYKEATQEFHPRVTHQMGEELVEAIQTTPIHLGEAAIGQAAVRRVALQVPDILDEHDYGATHLRPILVRLGYRSLLAVPLLHEERILGGLVVWRREPGKLSPEIVNLIQTFANQSVLAIENARLFREVKEKSNKVEEQAKELAEWNAELETRVAAQVAQLEQLSKLEHELSLASEIQKSMLPRSIPRIRGYEFSARMIPAKSVGGDFFDFIPLGGDLLGIAVGDVSDKGIPAALFMAMVRSLLRAETHPGRSLQMVLRNVNRHLMDMNDKEMFVTVLFGVLNSTTNQFQYVRAGHEAPIFFDAQGSFKPLPKAKGQALGVFDEIALDEQTVELSKGSILLLYSDGIPEAPNRQNISFGRDGIVRTIGRIPQASAQVVCDELIKAVSEHQAGSLQHDDITAVVVRANGWGIKNIWPNPTGD